MPQNGTVVVPGNIDLYQQPKVKNPDGSVSTVDSISIEQDGKEVLIPRVTPDGRHLNNDSAVAEFRKTGRHLGVFNTIEDANKFAEQLHNDYAAGKYDSQTKTNMASPVIAKLFERKEAIAKLPLAEQQKLWNFVYSQEVRPKIEQVRASGGQVEDDTVARDRFITSMTGGEQKPTPDVTPAEVAGKGTKFMASVAAGGAGLAGLVKNAAQTFGFKGPLVEDIGNLESRYNEYASVAPTGAMIGAGVGKGVGLGLAFEGGASVVPELASGPGGTPLLARASRYVGRLLSGSAAMTPLETEKGTGVSEHFVRDVGTIAIFDAFLGGGMFAGKKGVKAVSAMMSWFSSKGTTVSKDGLMTLSDEVKTVIGEMFPDKLEAIKNGAPAVQSPRTPNGALTVEEMTTALNTAQQRATEAELATKHAKRVEKIATTQAEKESAKLSKIAEAESAKANQAAKALKLKAFQRELSAYRKLTGQVPPQGSESWNALLGGAKAAELVPAQQAVKTARAAGVSEAGAIRDVVAEQPKIAEVVDALGGIPQKESISGKRERLTNEIADEFKNMTMKSPVPTGQATVSAGTPEVRSPEQVASPATQVKITAPKSPALTTFGIKVDTSTWKTPEDVVKGKADLTEQLKASAIKQANTIKDAFATKQITKAQADALNAQLSSELLKAAGSINKIKVPEVSRAARDRVRKATQVGAAQATAKAQQKLAEQTGRAVGSTVPSEEDAFLQIDELVKKGFRLIGKEPKAKEIMLAADKEGLDNASKLELLQNAFDELTKRK